MKIPQGTPQQQNHQTDSFTFIPKYYLHKLDENTNKYVSVSEITQSGACKAMCNYYKGEPYNGIQNFKIFETSKYGGDYLDAGHAVVSLLLSKLVKTHNLPVEYILCRNWTLIPVIYNKTHEEIWHTLYIEAGRQSDWEGRNMGKFKLKPVSDQIQDLLNPEIGILSVIGLYEVLLFLSNKQSDF